MPLFQSLQVLVLLFWSSFWYAPEWLFVRIFGSMLYSGSPGTKKGYSIILLNLQNLVIFLAKCGKFFYFLWQNLAIFVAKFGISNGNFLRCQIYIYIYIYIYKYTNQKDTYIGITENEFKTRYNQHTSSFRLPHKKSTTTLSEHCGTLKTIT